jgi:hypothetical protein
MFCRGILMGGSGKMAGMKALEAYRLGLFSQLVGFRFNGVEIIERIKPAEGALMAVAKKHVDALNNRNKETIDLVTTLDAIIVKNGFPFPGQPKTLDEYVAWAKAIRESTLAAAGGDVQVETAFHLGYALGDATTTASLGSMVEDLLTQVPDHPFLNKEADALLVSLANTRKQLVLLKDSPALPEKACAAAREAVVLVVNPPANHALAARILREMVKSLTPVREKLLDIFGT